MANISYGVNILPKTNNAYTLGNSDYKWSNIYTNQVNGINVADLNAVTDVQIDSTSIVSNGVANIPIASTSSFGVLKVGEMASGLQLDSSGYLKIAPSNSSKVKAGTEYYRPLTPSVQHESVFYGLAKAAGDTTQAASSNTIGTYTDNAKTAIQNMLSVAPTASPIFTGSISLGRYAGSTVGENSLAIGDNVIAQGATSVALGGYTKSWEAYSFSGGTSTQAWGIGSFAYGGGVVAAYPYSAAFGHGCAGTTISDWEANTSYSIGDIVYAQGYTFRCKVAHTSGSTFSSENNWEIEWGNVLIVGNGDATPSNALTLHNSGRLSVKDYIYVNANADGSGGTRVPHDIQINGTSIVSNGVANIPEAGSETYGILKTGYSTSGLQKDNSGYLKIYPATSDNIKAGTEAYRPIVPYHQHEAVFYGLAKVAGDSTQSASSNAVGVYTDNAKSAIQSMLAVAPINNARFTGTFSINNNTTIPLGVNSISIGGGSKAPGHGAIALGITAEAYAGASVAIGLNAKTKGIYSTAIGEYAQAQYQASVVVGTYNALDNIIDWAENTVYTENDLVYVDDFVYKCTTAHTSTSTFDSSKWSMVLNKLFVIGNGNNSSDRSNALTVDYYGNTKIKGNLYIGANADGSGGTLLAPIEVIRL